MTDHARLGASNSSIWMNCTAAPDMQEGRERKATIYTAEGNAAHELAEYMLRGEQWPSEITIDEFTIEIDDDMKSHVYTYTDEVQQLMMDADWSALEKRVHLDALWTEAGELPPEPLFGTMDFGAVKGDVAYLRDFKYGKGVGVEVKGNSQLLYYGTGFLLELMTEGVIPTWFDLGIVQPRFKHADGPIRTLRIHRDDLMTWAAGLKKIVDDIHNRVVHFQPGAQCRWCTAAGICEALATENRKVAHAALDDSGDVRKLIHSLDNGQMSEILDKLDQVSSWVTAVRAEAHERIDRGQTIPGWKLVPKRAIRKWTDETAVLQKLEHDGFDPREFVVMKTKSPAQIQKQLKHEGDAFDTLTPLIDATPSGNTLVRDDDVRRAVPPRPSAKDIFDDGAEQSAIETIEQIEQRSK
jgi:hypothetical protein